MDLEPGGSRDEDAPRERAALTAVLTAVRAHCSETLDLPELRALIY